MGAGNERVSRPHCGPVGRDVLRRPSLRRVTARPPRRAAAKAEGSWGTPTGAARPSLRPTLPLPEGSEPAFSGREPEAAGRAARARERAPSCSQARPAGGPSGPGAATPSTLASRHRGAPGGVPSSAFSGSRDFSGAHSSSLWGSGRRRRRPNRYTRRLPAPGAATPALIRCSGRRDTGAEDEKPELHRD